MKNYFFPITVWFMLSTAYFPNARAEFYTAIAELAKLLQTEEQVMNVLDLYLKFEEERLGKLKWLNEQFRKLHDAATNDAETFLSNPVNAFLLVKHLTSDWQVTNSLIKGSDNEALVQSISSQITNFPNNEDLYGAATALIRLQEIYLLDTNKMAQGRINGTTSSTELTAGDCFELGRHAYLLYDFNRTLLWMQESLNRYENEDHVKTAQKSQILEYMALAYFSMKNYTKATEITELILLLEPDHPHARNNLIAYRLKERNRQENVQDDDENTRNKSDVKELPKYIVQAYEKLCRGDSLKTPFEESRLNCYYTSNSNSYLLLQPVKIEVLNLKPRIVMYYDVIKDSEADIIKAISLPLLARATVNNATSGETEFANYRISKSTWLDNYWHALIPRVNQRIKDITGLDNKHSESLHVINYGIGGHYEPHLDYMKPEDKGSDFDGLGNRIATWIFYLSDVPAGGATVFPKIGVEVRPVKGAAAFWYNLYKNGTGVKDTLHAACPVLTGSKWVANKWLHEVGNEFTTPCSLNQYQ